MPTKTIDIEASSKSDRRQPVRKSDAAKASSAHSRINIPFNLANWKGLPDDISEQIAWFHQHSLEEGLGWKDVTEAIGYSESTIFRVIKGTYEGSYEKIAESIRSYRKIAAARAAIKHADFCQTRITRLVSGALSYALANNSITTITGESRMGKTATAKWWRDQNNHGRTAFVTAPAYGAARALLREIAECLGINRNTGITCMHESILRAFNRNRMLIVDEATRLLPKDRRGEPTLLEILRDIHDRTDCGLAFLCTRRFEDRLSKGEYQFEQVLGRIGMPVQLPREVTWQDIKPIVSQYVCGLPADLRDELLKIANDRGRLGILCETLKFASRIAAKSDEKLTADTIKTAIATRRQMMGETIYAKK
jgi:DNA transposition AAA+ family ATPase